MNRLKYNILQMIALLLATMNIEAQDNVTRNMFIISNINTGNRLSSTRVYSIVEDEDGAMWFSTKLGVDRYNGFGMRNYHLATDKKYSDASGKTINLVKDRCKHIYAYDNKGKVYQYDKTVDSFRQKWNLGKQMGVNLLVNTLCIDEQNTFWFATNHGLISINTTGATRHYHKGKSIEYLQLAGQHLIVNFTDGIRIYTRQEMKEVCYLPQYSMKSAYYDTKHNQLWIGTFHQGVVTLDTQTWKTITDPSLHHDIPTLPIRSITPYTNRALLFGIDGVGVYVYDRTKKESRLLFNTDGRPGKALKGSGIYALCCDRSGNIWIGSYSGGVDLAVPARHSLDFVRHEYQNPQSLIDNNANCIIETSDGNFWTATDKGVSIFDRKTGQWRHVLLGKVVLTLSQTASGKVLAGTYGNGVYEIDLRGNATPLYTPGNRKLKSDYIFALYSEQEGGAWIGCLDGDLAHITPKGILYLPIKQVQCIVESPDHRHIAVGTTNGGYLIDKQSLHYKKIFHSGEFPDKDYNHFIICLAFDGNNRLWIGTDGGGVYHYDLKSHRTENYTTEQALPSNSIYGLFTDHKNNLWVSTDHGIAYIRKGKVANINFFNGLECEYKRMAAMITSEGKLMFGSNNGVVLFSPDFAQGLNYNAKLRFTKIHIDGEGQEERESQLHNMIKNRELDFDHTQNTFSITFESINYQYQHDIQYQFYLEGNDRGWNTVSTGQTLWFTNLQPGNYTLFLKATSRSNGRQLDEVSLSIHIAQPWWNTTLAWICYHLLFALLIYFVWRYYQNRLRQKYYDDKIKLFINTAHNIRTPLSLVLAPLTDLAKDTTLSEKSRNYLDMARTNGNKLLNMVTELLDFQKADQTADEIHPQTINLAVLLKTQIDKFKPLAADKRIRLELTKYPETTFKTDLSKIETIFDNLISNAIKYTREGGEVLLSATADEHLLHINISDTGIGIPDTEKKLIFRNFYRASNAVETHEMGSGLGLRLTRETIERLKGTLSFNSVEGIGTTFTINLPLGNTIEAEETNDSGDTILFVDDNEDLRQYFRMSLGSSYHIVDVESGEKALEYLKDNVCDLVVSDVMMPGIQGDELCHRIKENKDTAWLPVILLTAKSGRDFMIEGLDSGADDYIAKPFDADILASKIASMLKNRRRMSNYYMQRSQSLINGQRPGPVPKTATEEYGSESKQSSEQNLYDQQFIDKATRLVLDHLKETDFNIDRLCQEMNMSRTLFYGKIKTMTGKSPQDFIRWIRLEQAALYLKNGESVLDVSIKTGFVNAKYFSTVFKKQFGVSPSKYL